jgi:hypothetical protein
MDIWVIPLWGLQAAIQGEELGVRCQAH